MSFAGFTFARPVWLAIGVAVAATITMLSVYSARRRKAALRSFGPRATSSMSLSLRGLKHGLVALGLFCGCVALARPERGFRWEEARRRGVDLMFAIDTSKSMLAPDLKPDRLTRAKLAVHDLVQKFEGDRVGITAFAGDAFLECPLTLDRGMFEQTLDALDTKIIPRGGTDVGAAIKTATEAMRNEPGNEKVLVLLTDGEDLEAHAIDAAKAALHAGVHVYTVGVGTAAGELLPLAPGEFVRDSSGAFVRSRLDEQTLGAIADAGGGQYRLLGATGHGLDALYGDVISKLPKEALGEKQNRVPLERYQWPLAIAIALLAAEALLPERRRRTVAIAALLVLAIPGAAHASPRTAEQAYHAGHYDVAAKEYGRAAAKHPDDAALAYDAAAAAYKHGDLPAAQSGYQKAVHVGDLALQQRAYYDLGDVQYRIGEKDVKGAPDKTIAAWKQALASYDGALALDGKDADAKFNRDLVKRKLDALEQQQKQKQDQQKQAQNQQQKNQQGGKGQQKKNQQGQGQQQAQNQQGQQPKNQQGQGQQQTQNQQGQQPKNQQGQGQQQAQNQQGQQPKNQQGQGQQQTQNQQGQQPKNQQGQGQQQAQNQQGQQPKDQQQNGPQPGQAGERGNEAKAPGQLSKQEAAMLLDALRGNEKVRVATGTRGRATADEPVAKDW